MKIFLFIVFLWSLAFSHMMKTDNQHVVSKNIESKAHHNLLYSEVVFTSKSFETIQFYTAEENTCNKSYFDKLIQVSETQVKLEHQVSKSLFEEEILLVDLEAKFTDR